ncbi:hypothetical protein BaRGS_00030141 [Batillaria attramentaria]|uniref:Uncharacterized protein n=1 Tax=Batillaria attramentaria TaxID=370345 RepID=A0ABD0JU69_9CAEN
MATGFSSFVSRLFNGKGKEKSTQDASGKGEKLLPASTSAPSEEQPSSQKDKLKRRKRKSPLFNSIRSRARPLSCIIAQPESPVGTRKLLDSKGGNNKENVTCKNASRGHKAGKAQRPVSCFVERPCDPLPSYERSPAQDRRKDAQYKSMPTRYVKNQKRPASCCVETLQQPPPRQRFDRISHQQAPNYVDCAREPYLENMGSSPNLSSGYNDRLPQQNPPSYVDMQSVQNHSSVHADYPLQSASHSTGNAQLSYYDIPDDGRDLDCSLRQVPVPKPRQNLTGINAYDLKSFFPPAAPARPVPRPRSACFPPRTEDGYVRPPPPYTPRPQSGCWLPYEGEAEPFTPRAAARGESGFAPQRPHLAPRPHSVYEVMGDRHSSVGADMGLASPRHRPSRLVPVRCWSAECLDEIDEGVLDLSPPPARPISHFMGPHPSARNQHSSEIFTSVEMLEKVGQPRSRVRTPRPVSCFVGSADESGYLSNGTPTGWLGGLSVSTGDILEALDGDEMGSADDELSFERSSSLRKAWSISSLLRNDSIQDRSLIVMRRRRQKMKDRRNTNNRSSSTETDEGVGDVRATNSTTSLVDEDDVTSPKTAEKAKTWLDAKLLKPRNRGPVTRLHSVHMKAWEIRLRRKQMLRKRQSQDNLHRLETLV